MPDSSGQVTTVTKMQTIKTMQDKNQEYVNFKITKFSIILQCKASRVSLAI